MNDQQLIGRVWRYPQSKKVHIYRLIGGGSPDILLNNLSFSKGFLQETFMNIGDTLRMLPLSFYCGCGLKCFRQGTGEA